MKLLRGRSKPLPAPPTETRTEDALSNNSSDVLSDLLNEIETSRQDLEVIDRSNRTVFLDEKLLLKQGKVHKTRIMSSWIACQSYLSQAEVDARARQSAFRVPISREDQSLSDDATSRSGMTSRTSTSTTLARSPSRSSGALFPSHGSGQFFGRLAQLSNKSKGSGPRIDLQGFRYESYSQASNLVNIVHDDSARLEEDWAKLEALWRESLYVAGPANTSGRLKKAKR